MRSLPRAHRACQRAASLSRAPQLCLFPSLPSPPPLLSSCIPPSSALLRTRSLSSSTDASGADPVTRLLAGKGSHVMGDTSTPLIDLTIDAAFRSAVSTHPDLLALACPQQGVRWTFAQLDAKVEAAAAGLSSSLNLKKGDKIGTWLPNVYEYVVMQCATARAGIIMVTLNPAYRLPELKHAINAVGLDALLMVPSLAASDYVGMVQSLLADKESVPSLRHILVINGEGEGEDESSIVSKLNTPLARGYSTVCEQPDPPAFSPPPLSPQDVINIQFTSGTTGLPKAVALTHHSILNNARAAALKQRLSHADRVCVPVPLYHCFGLVLGSLACVTNASALVLPSRARFDPSLTLGAVVSEGCTSLYGVPSMFIAMLSLPNLRSFSLSSLRTGIMAGSLCPPDIMRRVHRDLWMTEVTIAYGMTETSPVSWQSDAEGTPFDKLIHTVGRVIPHVECKVVDTETGETVPIGKRGELLTRGYVVMQGYWGNPEATAAAVDAEGWIRTGDLVTIDDEGYCTVVGRCKDIIIRGGENIAPKEVEDTCYACEEIVQDVSVIGVPDERLGEQICACVILRPGVKPGVDTAEKLRDFCRERISHFKVPKHVRFVEEFPMTVSGKVQKFQLVSDSARALGLRS